MEGNLNTKNSWRNNGTNQNYQNNFNNKNSYKSYGNYKYSTGNYNKNWESNKKTHFINIPIEDSYFIEAYNKFCQNIKSANLKDFYPEMLQKPGKLHMTVCVLDLGEDELKITKVHNLLDNLNIQIKEIAQGELKFNFEKFDSMGAKETTRVIFAKMKEDENCRKLSDIIHLIIKTLVDNQIIERSSFNRLYSQKLAKL
jgi:hypothetical protein